MHDILVAGGGLVGSYVAFRLAGMGHSVLVLEQKKELGEPVCCTGIISQECFNSFDIDNKAVLRRANSARIFSPSGKLIRLWREENQACIVDRAALDLAMADRAKDAGVGYLLGTRVKAIEPGDDRVVVQASHDGQRLSFEARAAVVATGSGSRPTERLGLGKNDNLVMGAQAEVETREVEEAEVYLGQEVAPDFFAWLVPTLPQKALVGLMVRRNPGFHLRKLLSRLKERGKITTDDAVISYRRILLRPPAKTYTRRLIVVGGAAGQVKPTTGGGIYYGLLCAEMAASSLHRALDRDDLTANSLADYERHWRGKLEKELKIGYRARAVYEHLSDRQVDRIFDIIRRNGFIEALMGEDELSFDWHGRAILKLAQKRTLAKALAVMKIPLQLIGFRDGEQQSESG